MNTALKATRKRTARLERDMRGDKTDQDKKGRTVEKIVGVAAEE